jgi:lysophospholipase L1-like esterase
VTGSEGPMITRQMLAEAGKSVVATVLVLLVVELLIRGTYAFRDLWVDYVPLAYQATGDYGPTPPWLDERGFLIPDPELVWRGRPGFEGTYLDIFGPVASQRELLGYRHSFIPRKPTGGRGLHTWRLVTNSEGFREREFPAGKSQDAVRIVTLGDSWTFGANVDQDEAYPRKLESLLQARYPSRNVEVFNLGVLGYASYNGVRLLETRALELNPDIVIIAFAMNEPNMAGYEPAQQTEAAERRTASAIAGRLAKGFADNSELFRLLRYWVLYANWEPRSMGEDLAILADSDPAKWFAYQAGLARDSLQDWMRISLDEFEAYHRRMIELSRSSGAHPILLYNEFWDDSPYLEVLRALSKSTGVPLVVGSALIGSAREEIERGLERRLGLEAEQEWQRPHQGDVTLVLRAYSADIPVSEALYVVGPDARLGALVPNRVRMYDDGTHGDQRAGDRVWSVAISAAPGSSFHYVYTNSGQEGEWEGLDAPAVRTAGVSAAEIRSTVYAPIETFGTVYMRADPWHTNADGYQLIAQAIVQVLEEEPAIRRMLVQPDGAPSGVGSGS